MRFSRTSIGLLLALLFGNAIILYANPDWFWLRFPTAIAFMFVLPGLAWLPALAWLQTSHVVERAVLVAGLSSLLSALALLIALLALPGLFQETTVLVTLSLVSLAGLLAQAMTRSRTASSMPRLEWPAPRPVLLILLVIIAVAAVTRLTRLGYAEFHEDELENMRLIVRAYKGEPYAPFLDSKGPIHWLLPAGLWFLNGWLSEAVARTPFVITSLLLVPMVYVLGRRLSGRDAIGLIAAGFVAVNGFFVAYARFVENQSLIVFWGAMAMWFAYRYYREELPYFLFYISLALAVGLIAHPDVLLYLPVFAYIIWQKKRALPGPVWRRQWPWLAGAGALFASLLATFYVPYLTDPQIGLVFEYFSNDRIGSALFYNSIKGMFDQDALYSTRYHAPVLVALLVWLLALNFARQRWRGWLLFLGLGIAAVSTQALPYLWLFGGVDLAFVPFALLTLALLLLPRTDFETKTLFLWFALPLGALVFLAQDAADHVQVAYPAWALLAALALADVWSRLSPPGLSERAGPSWRLPGGIGLAVKAGIGLALLLVFGLIFYYQYLAFNSRVIDYWQAKIDYETDHDSLYGQLYGSIARPRKIFGNPSLSGWKVVGYLWDTGTMGGDFRSVNESFAIPVWYTFETPRSCYEDPRHYWLRRGWQGWPKEEQQLIDQGYSLTRIVQVDGEPMLRLYEKQPAPARPDVLNLEDYDHLFDHRATPARFAHDEITGQHTSFNFAGKLRLLGIDLATVPVKAGELLPVTVYWESLAPMTGRYRGFVHLVGADDSRWGQHDDDPACRLLTSDMRPGQRSSRQFRLPVDPATPPGEYQVVFGLYDQATLERLDIWDETTGRPAGNSLVLGQVKVE